jgi:signal transduction histidine kinase
MINRTPMPFVSNSFKLIKQLSFRYPAVLSGYIIYSYLFIAMMRLFLKAKSGQLLLYDIYETFAAVPFMWLLASSLVKIIDMKTKLHTIEKERVDTFRALEIQQTQLNTMHEVARGFQHRINNPLTVISLTLSGMRRVVAGNPGVLERMKTLEESAGRIKQAVIDFSEAQKYEVERVGNVVGLMANPASSIEPDGKLHSGRSDFECITQPLGAHMGQGIQKGSTTAS